MTYFCIVFIKAPVLRMHAKFKVSSFSRSGDTRGSQNSRVNQVFPRPTPYVPVLHRPSFRSSPLPSISKPNLKSVASVVSELRGGPKLKVGHVTRPRPPITYFCTFFFRASQPYVCTHNFKSLAAADPEICSESIIGKIPQLQSPPPLCGESGSPCNSMFHGPQQNRPK